MNALDELTIPAVAFLMKQSGSRKLVERKLSATSALMAKRKFYMLLFSVKN
jgi:hypothetical protein